MLQKFQMNLLRSVGGGTAPGPGQIAFGKLLHSRYRNPVALGCGCELRAGS
jgi:hypothetical protein